MYSDHRRGPYSFRTRLTEAAFDSLRTCATIMLLVYMVEKDPEFYTEGFAIGLRVCWKKLTAEQLVILKILATTGFGPERESNSGPGTGGRSPNRA